jgi:hypothetical protein
MLELNIGAMDRERARLLKTQTDAKPDWFFEDCENKTIGYCDQYKNDKCPMSCNYAIKMLKKEVPKLMFADKRQIKKWSKGYKE